MSSDLCRDGLGLPQIKAIWITKLNGEKVGVPANQFIPWKLVIDTSKEGNETVAYMCCVDITGTVTTNAKNSVEISKNEYDRLVRKFKIYQECHTCMIDGFQDYSEPPETPNESATDPEEGKEDT